MNILVIGGSYFVGKYFVNIAKEKHHITVFNRGNRPLNLKEVQEVHGDRHNRASLQLLVENKYDVIVDFCAYNPGDISSLLEYLGDNISQYIFISTVDVYQRGLGYVLNEEAPYESRNFGGPEGEYILGKVALEKELKEQCGLHNVQYTILRPALIYGPENYAPREGIYFNWINKAGQILHPTDASGEFQFVYVADVAEAVLAAVGNESAYNEAYNLADNNIQTYETFADTLDISLDKKIERVGLDVKTVMEKAIPLPFALTKEESNLYDGRKALKLIGGYTDFEKGMMETILFFNSRRLL